MSDLRDKKMEEDSPKTETLDFSSAPHTEEELPLQNWDRYRIQAFLGQGGMARVYKAFDPVLRRWVALKFLRADDPILRKRLLKEAQAQAQIQHPGICEIYEVSEVQGRPYIAMRLIEGHTFHQTARQMSLQQKVLILEKVALAIHEAHRLGIIHRDLKPGNIMVEETEAGWHPYVMDFGLAREIMVEEATVTGIFFGTPSFMAPEQAWTARRPEWDRRSDVYSLGATLYSVISGKRPYEGTEIEVLMKMMQEEPVPIRRLVPEIPVDLETIVTKCMEREPHRRYDSAKSLAEDLRRYLDGEPILARPVSRLHRLHMKARKNRTVVGISAAALALIVILGGAGLYTWWQSGRRIEIVREFAQVAETMEWRMRVAYMAPLHDITPEIEQVRNEISEVQNRMRALGRITEGPGNYALGRAHLALTDFRAARQYLEKAWNAGYQTKETSYSLGLALGYLYQRELEALQRINQPAQREYKRKEIESSLRDRALQFLRRSRGGRPLIQEYVEGIISFYEKRYEEALAKARVASEKGKWLYEGHKLEGDIFMALGVDQWDKGNYSDAMKHYTDAGVAYRKAMEIGRSDASVYESECWRWLQILEVESATGGTVEQPIQEALNACDLALKANPRSSVAYSRKSRIFWRSGEEDMFQGKNIEGTLENTINTARTALSLDPYDVYSHFELGNALSLKAEFDQYAGRNPASWHHASVESYNKAIQIDPSLAAVHNNLGVAWVNFSRYQIGQGQDPRPSIEEAVKSCRSAIRLSANFLPAWNTLGNAYITEAMYQNLSGIDPVPALNRAIESYTNGLKAHPNHPVLMFNLGTVYLDRGKNEVSTGADPNESFRFSRQYSENALNIDAQSFPMAYNNIGQAFLWEAKHRMQARQDFDQLLQKAIDYSQRSIDAGSNEVHLAYNNILESYIIQAAYLARSGKDFTSLLSRASKIFQQALAANPDSDTYVLGAKIKLLTSKWNEAGKLLKKATELNPKNASIYWAHSELYRSLAEQDPLRHDDLMLKAEQARSRAREINPNIERFNQLQLPVNNSG